MSGLGWLMRRIAAAHSWLRVVTHRSQLEEEMQCELAAHLEQLTRDLEGRGFSAREARRQAGIAMGSMLTAKEDMRGELGLASLDALQADLLYALRLLRKDVGFSLIAVLSLALAIGANTTIFSAAKQLLYDRLDVPNPRQLRLLSWEGDAHKVVVHAIWGDWDEDKGTAKSTIFSYPVYRQIREQNALSDLFAFKRTQVNAVVAGDAQRVVCEMVSGNYYAELGARPVLGRAILPGDDAKSGSGAVAVISYGLWDRGFGKSPSVLGKSIRVNNTPLTIVGVNPAEFTGAADVQVAPDLVVPLSMQPLVSPMPGVTQPVFDNELWWVNVMARFAPEVNERTAAAALETQLAAAVHATMTVKQGDTLPELTLRDGSRGLFAEHSVYAQPMTVLMGAVSLVLILACANIANLMLARGATRRREMSVRLALGAGRGRIFRQMLVESLTLAVIGGAAGLLLGYLGRNLLPRMLANAWEEHLLVVHFDWGVFAFSALITIMAGVLFGLAPAIAASREDMGHGLKLASTTATRRHRRFGRGALIALQVALSTLLVIAAGLFLRTLARMQAVDVGFRSDHVLLMELNPPNTEYPPGQDIALHQRMSGALAEVPGVESVTVAASPYISQGRLSGEFYLAGADPKAEHEGALFNIVGNHFFATMGIPILAGRGFDVRDTASSPRVVVINQGLARKAFPHRDPLGQQVKTIFEDDRPATVIGICGDTRYADLKTDPPPQYLVPYVQQKQVGGMTYAVRSRGRPENLVPALRAAAHAVAPDLPFTNVRTQQQQIDGAMQQERLFVTLTSGFGLLALALASVGIYGVLGYSVAQRTKEIGVRLAVGAQPRQVFGLVLQENMMVTIGGIACGAAAALVLARLIRSMLYGVGPTDAATLVASGSLMLAVALAASWIPAQRAARMDPVEVLRDE